MPATNSPASLGQLTDLDHAAMSIRQNIVDTVNEHAARGTEIHAAPDATAEQLAAAGWDSMHEAVEAHSYIADSYPTLKWSAIRRATELV